MAIKIVSIPNCSFRELFSINSFFSFVVVVVNLAYKGFTPLLKLTLGFIFYSFTVKIKTISKEFRPYCLTEIKSLSGFCDEIRL